MAIDGSQTSIQGNENLGLTKGIKNLLQYGHGIFVQTGPFIH
jgi:hypothetical protein